jgi:hypothetical protein
MRWFGSWCVVVVALSAGCTRRNPEYCDVSEDCDADPARPFCDLNGAFPESGFRRHQCSAMPPYCALNDCNGGCTPGVLACDGDQLTSCNADALTTSTVTCPLGCADGELRCKTFEPSNGLGPAFEESAGEPDYMFGPGTRINTDTGVVENADGTNVPVRSLVLAQTGRPSIRVFMARSAVFESATISGTDAFAFVAAGSLTIRGYVDASANGSVRGPGAQSGQVSCAGADAQEYSDAAGTHANGAGGAGNATVGGGGGGPRGCPCSRPDHFDRLRDR